MSAIEFGTHVIYKATVWRRRTFVKSRALQDWHLVNPYGGRPHWWWNLHDGPSGPQFETLAAGPTDLDYDTLSVSDVVRMGLRDGDEGRGIVVGRTARQAGQTYWIDSDSGNGFATTGRVPVYVVAVPGPSLGSPVFVDVHADDLEPA